MENRLDILESNNFEFSNTLESTNTAIESFKTEVKEDINGINKTINKTTSQMNEVFHKKIDSLQTETNSNKDKITNLQSKTNSNKGKIASLQSETKGNKGKITNLQNEINSNKGKIDNLQSETKTNKGKIAELKEEDLKKAPIG